MLAIVGKFLNGTGVVEQLLKAEIPSLTWADYCTMTLANQLIWEEKSDAQNKAMLLLMNSKNNNANKDLYILHTHKATAQLTQKPLSQWQDSYRYNIISRSSIIIASKRGIRTKRRVMKQNLKIRITATQAP